MNIMIGDIFSWFLEIFTRAIKLNLNNALLFDVNLKYLETVGIILGIGLLAALIAGLVYRGSIPGFIGWILNILLAMSGAIAGSFLFLTYVFNMVPSERGLKNFENTYDLDYLFGILLGGTAGSLLIAFIFAILCSLFFGKRQ